MKKSDMLIILSLLICLFIYLFYRTEKTVVNELVIRLITIKNYMTVREAVTNFLPLGKPVIYSLPEGLWVFCITLTSRFFYISLFNHRMDAVYVPLIFSIGLEFFQLFGFTNGRFDFMDIWISIIFWFLVTHFFRYDHEKQNILKPVSAKSFFCFASYGIVYLSHVLK